MGEAENKELVQRLWQDLYAKKFDKVGSYMADDGLYEDVAAPDAGAVGPKNTATRLRAALEPVQRCEHQLHRLVAEGETVVLEHTEVWHFETGEVMRNRFVTIHVVENGKIKLWRDYWDLGTMMSQAPQSWLEHLAKCNPDEWS